MAVNTTTFGSFCGTFDRINNPSHLSPMEIARLREIIEEYNKRRASTPSIPPDFKPTPFHTCPNCGWSF